MAPSPIGDGEAFTAGGAHDELHGNEGHESDAMRLLGVYQALCSRLKQSFIKFRHTSKACSGVIDALRAS
ncbi:hypothetical protein, partial [Streptosporangium sp. NPDC048865]|uniref:hypothetical protein n=1 Tax=Streptosporangium sp. NPDC048865 TaxID=3155766 RepID=UPI0034317B21